MAKSSLSCRFPREKAYTYVAFTSIVCTQSTSVTQVRLITCPGFCLYLGNELDDFDKDVEWHVSGHHTARSLREEGGDDGAEATADRRSRVEAHTLSSFHTHMLSKCCFLSVFIWSLIQLRIMWINIYTNLYKHIGLYENDIICHFHIGLYVYI